MQLTIKLFAGFQRDRFVVATREYPMPPTLGEVVDELGIRRPEVGVLLVNGRNMELADRAADGDIVAIFPVIGGG
jgi:sulfur carrier protein ThiS